MTIDSYDVLRRQAAVAAMQAVLTRCHFDDEKVLASLSVEYANALVDEIKKHEER